MKIEDAVVLDDDAFLNSMASVETPTEASQEEQQEPEASQGQGNESNTEADKADGDLGEQDKPADGDDNDTNEGGEAKPADKAEGEKDLSAPADKSDESQDKTKVVESDKPAAPANKQESEKKPDAVVEGEKPSEPVNYEEAYKKIVGPLKANGKTIDIKTPEEAVRLMQLGANYGKRMQELAPARKAVAMLENSGLLGKEDDLSFLIDLHNKNPEAIKKLVKESGIDTFDLDQSQEPNYVPGSHKVSDKEMSFRAVLEDVVSRDTGQETIQIMENTWDAASKQAAWDNPQILASIQESRENGAYAKIVAEMDRRKALGLINASEPFLQSYVSVGNELEAQAKLNGHTQSGHEPTSVPAGKQPTEADIVTTRTAAPKTDSQNGDRARAAAPARSTPSPAKEVPNPLSMSDEEFMKRFGNQNFG